MLEMNEEEKLKYRCGFRMSEKELNMLLYVTSHTLKTRSEIMRDALELYYNAMASKKEVK